MKDRIIIITSIHLIFNIILLTFFIPFAESEDVLITVGDGAGFPGSSNNQVTVYMQNLNNVVKGLQVEICDEGDYLVAVECTAIGRASEFECNAGRYNKRKNKCNSIALFSLGDLVEQGKGPIAIINYDVSERAPSERCVDLNVKLKSRYGSYQSATKVSDEKKNLLDVGAESGRFCFEGGEDEEETTTTTPATTTAPSTTTAPATTTTPVTTTAETPTLTTTIITDSNIINGGNTATTTLPKIVRSRINDTGLRTTPDNVSTPATPDTTAGTELTAKTIESPIESPESISELSSKTTVLPLSSSCSVLITPSWSMIDSGGKLQFSAKTILDGEEVEGTYKWDIVPASTIGSTIDKNGVFAAGSNTAGYNSMETVRVIDMIHENNYSKVSVIIKAEKNSLGGCELSVSPLSVAVLPGETIRFFASNSGKTCVKGSYKWGISSKIGSQINSKGIYTAEKNDTGSSVIDIITAEDAVNETKVSALVNVLLEEKVEQSAPGSTQEPKQEIKSVKGAYSKTLIVTALVIVFLIAIILFWFIKK